MESLSTQLVLVLSPHPDDESLGCGGTIRQITSAGGTVDVLYMTRGERGMAEGEQPTAAAMKELAERRSREAQAACQVLGVRHVEFLAGRDSALRFQQELAGNIAFAIQSRGYRTIFCPWPGDGHIDHKATFSLMCKALQPIEQDLEIWLYEVWTPMQANMTIPIDSTLSAKLQAIESHVSQTAIYNYKDAFQSLARYRSILCPGVSHVEAFYSCTSKTLLHDESLPWSIGRQSVLVTG